MSVREVRVVVPVEDFDSAVEFSRDALDDALDFKAFLRSPSDVELVEIDRTGDFGRVVNLD